MPTYSFRCTQCSHTLSRQCSMSEYDGVKLQVETHTCPNCGKVAMKRVIDKPNFVLKGDYWAKDGYGGDWGELEQVGKR
jgi:putative FmdB family regulatory protein